jgi:hypothetical protein
MPKLRNRCVQWLKQVFNSVGASSEKFEPSVEDLPDTFDHIEGEVDALDEVIAGHGDFCALLASRGTAVAFMKTGYTHGKIVNRQNFSLSPADLTDIPSLARSIGNRFITQIWMKGGRDLAGDFNALNLGVEFFLLFTHQIQALLSFLFPFRSFFPISKKYGDWCPCHV